MEPLKWNPENKWKTEFGTDKTVKQLIRQAFWLIKFNLTIKTEYRKMKMEKN